MGKGIIKSGGADGFYNVELTFERKRVDKTISLIDTRIEELNAKIDAIFIGEGTIKEREKKIALCELERNLYIKRKEYIQNNMPEDLTVSAWCADLTEDISGNVGTIEVPGERGIVQIQPGYESNSIYDATRDGQLQPSIASTPAATFYNLAMLPGWQKWKPTYRYGVISNIDTDANTCDVKLDEVESSQQNLDINQELDLTGISVSYMSCDSSVFEDGDNVLVKFEGQAWAGAQVVGFKDNPKACAVEYVCVEMIVWYSKYCFVWDVVKNEYASVPKNDGNPASFPCDVAEITNWRSGQDSIGSSLFSTDNCGRSMHFSSTVSCNIGDFGTAGSESDSVSEVSNCGCDFMDYGACSVEWDFTSKCYLYPPSDDWSWSGTSMKSLSDHILWEGPDNKNAQKITFLNNSGVQCAFRIELEKSSLNYWWSAADSACGGAECDNDRLDVGEYSQDYKYHTPISENILEINAIGTKSWDNCNDLGEQTQNDYFNDHKLNNTGVYSDTVLTQIYTVEARTLSRDADCANNDYGICNGPGCVGPFSPCPWQNEIYTASGLKIAAQVGRFEDTDGIDPTKLSRNSSFESAISDMYDALRVKEGIPDDDIALARIFQFILKG